MIGVGIHCGDVAETQRDLRRHSRKSLKTLNGNILRRRAETAETPSQVIENIAETETETQPYPYRIRACARMSGRGRVRSKSYAKQEITMLIKLTGPATIGFDAPPDVGTKIQRNDNTYTCTGHRPHVGRNGPTIILLWESNCAECGGGFIVSSGMTGIKGFNVRCPEHHKAGDPAGPTAKKSLSIARRNFRRRARR